METIRYEKKKFSNDNYNEILEEEHMTIINNLLFMVDQMKKDLDMSRWAHMPKGSKEYQYHFMVCGYNEAFAYYKELGTLIALACRTDDTIIINLECYKTAVPHYKKAQAIFNLLGHVVVSSKWI